MKTYEKDYAQLQAEKEVKVDKWDWLFILALIIGLFIASTGDYPK